MVLTFLLKDTVSVSFSLELLRLLVSDRDVAYLGREYLEDVPRPI